MVQNRAVGEFRDCVAGAVLLLAGSGLLAQGTGGAKLSGGFGRATAPAPAPTPTAIPSPPLPVPTPLPRPTPVPVPTSPPLPVPIPTALPAPTPKPIAPASPSPSPAPGPTARPTTNSPSGDSPKASAEVAVGYVLVPFVVTDRKGRPVRDLSRSDVTLLSDGVPVDCDLFERSDDAPVSFTILLDGSGSMGLVGKMDGARAAIRALLDARIPGDDFSLQVFSEGTMREVVPFTEDAARIRRAVDAVKPWGTTAFYDALARMPDKSLLGRNGARAIILLTDGLDNASALTEKQLEDLLETVDVPVYPLGIRSSATYEEPAPGVSIEKMLNIQVLGHVARVSGGRLGLVQEPEQLAGAVDRVLSDLRAQYLLGFTPTGAGPVRYRRLSLRIAGPTRPVRVRAGYRGTDPPARIVGLGAPESLVRRGRPGASPGP